MYAQTLTSCFYTLYTTIHAFQSGQLLMANTEAANQFLILGLVLNLLKEFKGPVLGPLVYFKVLPRNKPIRDKHGKSFIIRNWITQL